MDREKREMRKRIGKLVDPYRVTRGKKFRLEDFDPGDTGGLGSDQKPMARELLEKGIQWLAEEQDKLYAQDRHSLLLLFQAMDAAGKDGTIRHVMSGVNPQGCQVFSFKQPSMEELDHDLPVALPEVPAGARPHRHLQPVVLRGGPRGPCAPGTARAAEVAAGARDQGHLEGAPRRHRRVRAVPGAAGHHRAQVLPARLAQGAEAPFPAAPRTAGKELEVLPGRHRGAKVLGRLHGGLRGRHPSHGLPGSPVVRGARGQQVVYAAGGRGGDRRSALEARPCVSRGRRGPGEGNRRARRRRWREKRCAWTA